MTITVVGHGYVGLVTACVFADFGNKVWVVGHTPEKIERIKSGDPIIYEPGLAELLQKNLKKKRLIPTLSYDEAVAESEIVFITVGTPPSSTGHADLSAVLSVAKDIGKNLKKGFTVVSCKSTVPVGTNLKVEEIIRENMQKGAEVGIASCPEFLREGTAIHDTLNPDRVVIGSQDLKAIEKLLELHSPIESKKVITNLASAELIKYASNAMLATKISFANLISLYCEKTGGNVEEVLASVGEDKRIGKLFLDAGIGYGGSCFPKDVLALISTGRTLSIDTKLLDGVEEVNKTVYKNFVEKVTKNAKGKKIAVWGLAFKPNTDDIRFAPSLSIIDDLLQSGFEIHAYDPAAMENVKKRYQDKIHLYDDQYECVKDADVLAIMTEWNEFRQADLQKVKSLMKNPLIVDGRNIYDPDDLKSLGFTYISTGRI